MNKDIVLIFMYAFSRAVNSHHSEDIKLLMQKSSGKGLISFAGGMPNNDLFPVGQIDRFYEEMNPDLKKLCFQYGPTTGYPPLVSSIEKLLEQKGFKLGGDKVMITTGSLQAISIITREFVNEGDIILTEKPCFVGALSVFETYGAKIIGIPIDEHGIIIEELEKILASLQTLPKFLYITPNFHNPAGILYSSDRRKALLQTLSGTDIILLEDDAYGDLYFESEDRVLTQPLKTFKDYDVDIIYTGSFSKILGPGFRLGFMLSSPEIFDKAESIKQALDACTSNFMQILANGFISSGYLHPYLDFLRKEYRERKDLLHLNLQKYLPDQIKWVEPRGGFYIWLKLPEGLSAHGIFKDCLQQGVVFVEGRTFDPDNSLDSRLRLSFSNMEKKDIEKGVIILSEVIKNSLKMLQTAY